MIERRRLTNSEGAGMEPDVNDGASEHPHTAVLLGDLFERSKKPGLVHQVGGVTRPAFGHRPTEEHADAAGAVCGGNGACAGPGTMARVPVLYVMADGSVVHDVIERDGAVVPRTQTAFLLRWFERGVNG